jgi:hypothetical protein
MKQKNSNKLDINTKEYSINLEKFMKGELSVKEWKSYCNNLVDQLLYKPKNKSVKVRLKNR